MRIEICLVFVLALWCQGCSLLFITGAPDHAVRHPVCTDSKVAPAFDTLFAGLEAARVIYAASANERVYRDPKQPLSRNADIAIGAGLGTLFIVSAIYGYTNTAMCGDLKEQEPGGREAEEEHAATPPRAASRRTPSTTITIAAGFHFGSSPAAFTAACESAGYQATEEQSTVACTGTPAPVVPPARAWGKFCGGSLCSVHLLQGPWPRPGAALATLQEARARITEHYGSPTNKGTVIPSDCEEELAACLTDGRASVFYEWRFNGGFAVNLALLVIGDQVAVGILYATANGLRATQAQQR